MRLRTRRGWGGRTAALVAVVVVTVAAGCSSDDATRSDDAAIPEGIEHVHGLGIDPADGTLYAATHYGLFRIPDNGVARRVGGTAQDTMGFTVVGANDFLASGHPDPRDPDLPPLLGLIESTNAGRRWQPTSLLGEADFHALVARHGRVYGYDATTSRFMVSTDRVSWDERSSPPGLISVAVDPTDPDQLLATTTTGVIASGDGGRTWEPIQAPAFVLVSWADDGTVAAVDADGTVARSTDRGTSWSTTGSLPGPPEAFLVIDARSLVAAVAADGIYRSNDGGATWTLTYRDSSN